MTFVQDIVVVPLNTNPTTICLLFSHHSSKLVLMEGFHVMYDISPLSRFYLNLVVYLPSVTCNSVKFGCNYPFTECIKSGFLVDFRSRI